MDFHAASYVPPRTREEKTVPAGLFAFRPLAAHPKGAPFLVPDAFLASPSVERNRTWRHLGASVFGELVAIRVRVDVISLSFEEILAFPSRHA
jgi:hypothetical protein